jgi:hypothetical protein
MENTGGKMDNVSPRVWIVLIEGKVESVWKTKELAEKQCERLAELIRIGPPRDVSITSRELKD